MFGKMYAEITNPATHGREVYANQGSARRTTNYLKQDVKAAGTTATFFSGPGNPLRTADEAVALLNNHHEGPAQDAAKFYSLVLSPSADEQLQICNDPRALQRYTQDVMASYAQKSHPNAGRRLGETGLAWAATVHQERSNRGTDEGVQGEKKTGRQLHVHIISASSGRRPENCPQPVGAVDRFNRVQFQAGARFGAGFGRPVRAGRPTSARPARTGRRKRRVNYPPSCGQPAAFSLRPVQGSGLGV